MSKPDRETLYKLYVEERKTLKEIGIMYGVSRQTISNYLTKYKIPLISTRHKRLDDKTKANLNKENLYRLYHIEKKTQDEIGELFGIDRGTVKYYLKKYKIPSKREILNKDTLYKLYIEEDKTHKEIGKILGYPKHTIQFFLSKYGITKAVDLDKRNEEICRLYCIDKKSANHIAKLLGVGHTSILKHLRKNNIEIREPREYLVGKHLTEEHKEKISRSSGGNYHNGVGHIEKRPDGYIRVFIPKHPNATKDGYVAQHRLVMEKHLGRYLAKDEIVHHINGDRSDNRIENLMLFKNNSEHIKFHHKLRKLTKEKTI